jgi:hypothetical protein
LISELFVPRKRFILEQVPTFTHTLRLRHRLVHMMPMEKLECVGYIFIGGARLAKAEERQSTYPTKFLIAASSESKP